MSDLMLHGVLNMPIDVWGDSDIDKIQRASIYQEASEIIKNSTPNAKIQAVIDAHKGNKCGCDKLDYADDLIVVTLEGILKPEVMK